MDSNHDFVSFQQYFIFVSIPQRKFFLLLKFLLIIDLTDKIKRLLSKLFVHSGDRTETLCETSHRSS